MNSTRVFEDITAHLFLIKITLNIPEKNNFSECSWARHEDAVPMVYGKAF